MAATRPSSLTISSKINPLPHCYHPFVASEAPVDLPSSSHHRQTQLSTISRSAASSPPVCPPATRAMVLNNGLKREETDCYTGAIPCTTLDTSNSS
eukprot:scaffold5168_cov176-Amphora_coffeaeformis.AAC.4